MNAGAELIRYDAMCRAIAAAYEIDEVKEFRDKAKAIAAYSAQAKNTENERRACEIRLRAERRAGQLLGEMEKAKGAIGHAGPGRGKTRSASTTTFSGAKTLSSHGISKQQSSDWQKLAEIPEDKFEAALAATDKPTTAGIIAAHAAPKKNAVDDGALWLWGRLLDFERMHILDREPHEICATMLDHMRDTVRDLAPRVAAWLQRISV